MATQVKLRNGTYTEHENFVGAPCEVTVETTSNTLVVHDGVTRGGHPLTKADDFISFKKQIISDVEAIEVNISQSHNHDDRYAQIVHNHDGRYLKPIIGTTNVYCKTIGGYNGLANGDGDDGGWFRTSRLGLIPYQDGGYSNIGTSSWRFNEGWFNVINASTVVIPKNGNDSTINFDTWGNDPGFIKHVESPTNTSSMRFSVSDDYDESDKFYFGATPGGVFTAGASLTTNGLLALNKGLIQNNTDMKIGGIYVYFDGNRPADAPDGSISFG